MVAYGANGIVVCTCYGWKIGCACSGVCSGAVGVGMQSMVALKLN